MTAPRFVVLAAMLSVGSAPAWLLSQARPPMPLARPRREIVGAWEIARPTTGPTDTLSFAVVTVVPATMASRHVQLAPARLAVRCHQGILSVVFFAGEPMLPVGSTERDVPLRFRWNNGPVVSERWTQDLNERMAQGDSPVRLISRMVGAQQVEVDFPVKGGARRVVTLPLDGLKWTIPRLRRGCPAAEWKDLTL